MTRLLSLRDCANFDAVDGHPDPHVRIAALHHAGRRLRGAGEPADSAERLRGRLGSYLGDRDLRVARYAAVTLAQTGDPQGTGMGGMGDKLPAEFSKEPHVRGTVSMARTNDPNSAQSQFFIVFKDSPFLDGKYTVWGKVTKGMDCVDKIKRGEPPTNPDKMIRVRVAADVKE